MADYIKYINALRKCAKEHEYEIVPFAHIRTADLCNDTADLLEKLETGNTITIPNDATNGDVFNTLFDIDKDVEEIESKGGYIYLKISEDVWDTLYQKGAEE